MKSAKRLSRKLVKHRQTKKLRRQHGRGGDEYTINYGNKNIKITIAKEGDRFVINGAKPPVVEDCEYVLTPEQYGKVLTKCEALRQKLKNTSLFIVYVMNVFKFYLVNSTHPAGPEIELTIGDKMAKELIIVASGELFINYIPGCNTENNNNEPPSGLSRSRVKTIAGKTFRRRKEIMNNARENLPVIESETPPETQINFEGIRTSVNTPLSVNELRIENMYSFPKKKRSTPSSTKKKY
jgi:hypothetical protein